jgi:uncharacterized cupredoxin-like copper-binding protein
MEVVTTVPRTAPHRPLAALSKLTIAALVGIALALVYAQAVLLKHFDPALTVFAGLMLLGAGLIATGWRWTPLVGALLSALVVAGNSGPVIHDLSHPESFHSFVFILIAVAFALVGFASGSGAAIQNYRGASQRAPRGMGVALALLAGLCAGAILVGALPRASGAGVSPEVLASLPALGTPNMYFDQTEIKARVGETVALRFVNSHGAPHSFDIDELNVHVPVVAGQQGLIMFKPSQPGSYTFYCGIPGHREAGMVGTLIVEP